MSGSNKEVMSISTPDEFKRWAKKMKSQRGGVKDSDIISKYLSNNSHKNINSEMKAYLEKHEARSKQSGGKRRRKSKSKGKKRKRKSKSKGKKKKVVRKRKSKSKSKSKGKKRKVVRKRKSKSKGKKVKVVRKSKGKRRSKSKGKRRSKSKSRGKRKLKSKSRGKRRSKSKSKGKRRSKSKSKGKRRSKKRKMGRAKEMPAKAKMGRDNFFKIVTYIREQMGKGGGVIMKMASMYRNKVPNNKPLTQKVVDAAIKLFDADSDAVHKKVYLKAEKLVAAKRAATRAKTAAKKAAKL